MTTANLSPLILALVRGEEFRRSLQGPGCGAGFRLWVPAFVWWAGFRALVLGSVLAAGSLLGSLLAAERVLGAGPVPGPGSVPAGALLLGPVRGRESAPGPVLAAELLLGPLAAQPLLEAAPASAS
jgi:hypothetical protein